MAQRLSQDEYDYVFERAPRLCVDLVVINDQGILLTLRSIEPFKGQWHFPGGRVYKDESIQSAAKRIALAETGLDVEVLKCVGYLEFFQEMRDGKESHTVSIVLLVRPISGEFKLDNQASEAGYFKTAPANTIPEHREVFEREVGAALI